MPIGASAKESEVRVEASGWRVAEAAPAKYGLKTRGAAAPSHAARRRVAPCGAGGWQALAAATRNSRRE